MPEDGHQRPHRPVPYADLTQLIDAAGGERAQSPPELAASSAAAVLAAGRRAADEPATRNRLVELADVVGLGTLAALWQDMEPDTLPGALWALYLLRHWCRRNPTHVALLWRAGEPYAPADAVVAGVGDFADEQALSRFADDVLSGAYRGSFDVALERASAFLRVIAVGRRETASGGSLDAATGVDERADRNERAARGLDAAAARWRAGTLQ